MQELIELEIIVCGTPHKVKMSPKETYEMLIDRALAADGRHIYDNDWELTSASGIVMRTDLSLETHPGYQPFYLWPRAGVTA